ncbi:hypothetical protein FXO38_00962 [Capsicum annuum]|nr:hypothetical protein FXO37_06781 [Capsicum annuum]KAF3683019.1 hypothetical protein FXO38_00962 [Capsicum annuum]
MKRNNHGTPKPKYFSPSVFHHQTPRFESSPNILVGAMSVSTSDPLEINMEWETHHNTDSGPSLLGTASDGGSKSRPTPIRPELMDDNSHEHCQPYSSDHHQPIHNLEGVEQHGPEPFLLSSEKARPIEERPSFCKKLWGSPLLSTLIPPRLCSLSK